MPDKTLHIVLETGSISGGVRVAGELANRLAARGWTVKIWSIHERQTMSWFPLDQRVEWISFFRTGSTQDYDQLAVVLAKQHGYKMATYWATAWAVQYASRPGEGLYLVQDIEVVYADGPMTQAQVLKTYDLGLRHLTTSKWVQTEMQSLIGQCDYIGIGLDPYYKVIDKTKVSGPRGKEITINVVRGSTPIACARIQALKGWVELCETARYLNNDGYPILTFGQNATLPMFARHTHRQNPSNKILRDLYNGAAVFFSTSRHEGFSLPPLEAMACGCPVVMTDAQGNMEYARDGVNCLIAVTPRDVADKVEQLIKDKALAAELSRSGLQTVQAYTWDSVIARTQDLLLA